MALEDDFSDIIKKARTGQQRSLADVSRSSGLAEAEIRDLERGHTPKRDEHIVALADALGLRTEPLRRIAGRTWAPEPMPPFDGLETVVGSIGGYEVKGYVLRDAGEAVMIDTGYNPAAMLDLLARCNVRLKAICLTHGHADHAEGIRDVLQQWPVPVYLGRDDRNLLDWSPPATVLKDPEDGASIQVGALTLSFMATPGHTPGGICYRVETPTRRVCFVGDTLFAGSIGRSNPANLYAAHLESVRQRVLKLNHDTLLFPGHGPATTVREEVVHNPFGMPM